MNQQLPEGAQRVQQVLTEKGSKSEVRLLPDSTATALDAAKALGVPVSHIGKSIVFGSQNRVVVVVVCGDQRVDTHSLAQTLGLVDIKPLRADDVRRCTGYVIGGVSPFGLHPDIEILIDSRLRTLDTCYVAAGHPKAIVQVDPDELMTITGATASAIAV